MPISLTDIVEATRERVKALHRERGDWEGMAADAAEVPVWAEALRGETVSVIAEIKRRSPSAGTIQPDLHPASFAAAYEEGGAAAVSVLTEPTFFGGSIDDLRTVRETVHVPVLRKDFVLDPLQLFEARACGATAVLLIVRILSSAQLAELYQTAVDLGLGVLVEVHERSELEVAFGVDPAVVGVNARDLDLFTVDLERVREVITEIPSGVVTIAESGLRTRADVERVAEWGADGVLVGTHLAASSGPTAAVKALVGVPRRSRGAVA